LEEKVVCCGAGGGVVLLFLLFVFVVFSGIEHSGKCEVGFV